MELFRGRIRPEPGDATAAQLRGPGRGRRDQCRGRPRESNDAHRQEERRSRLRLDSWEAILVGVWRAFNQDNISIVAGGVTFSILLAIFPAMAAFVAIYGLVADVSQAPRHIAALAIFFPP